MAGRKRHYLWATVIGLAYRGNLNDPWESPAIKIIEELADLGADMRGYEPLLRRFDGSVSR